MGIADPARQLARAVGNRCSQATSLAKSARPASPMSRQPHPRSIAAGKDRLNDGHQLSPLGQEKRPRAFELEAAARSFAVERSSQAETPWSIGGGGKSRPRLAGCGRGALASRIPVNKSISRRCGPRARRHDTPLDANFGESWQWGVPRPQGRTSADFRYRQACPEGPSFFGRHPPGHLHLFEQAASQTARAKEHVK